MAEQALQKHTPGPWVLGLDEAGIWSVAAGETVAQVCAPDEWIGYPDEELPGSVRDQLLANARLIAAAPGMSEALEPFADIDGEGDEDFPDSTPVTVRFGRSTIHSLTLGDFRRARAAHAKAEACS